MSAPGPTVTTDAGARDALISLSRECGLEMAGCRIRRSSSRFCLGVEHGDYNGMELFGVGTDRFLWMAYRPNDTGCLRLFSGNFPGDGLIELDLSRLPEPGTLPDSWARFPAGAAWMLSKESGPLTRGMDAVLIGNIPGGGMSRSASLTLNLLLSLAEVNGIPMPRDMGLVDLAQAVENHYIGSPCGNLDQIMILFAKEGMGTHYRPSDRSIRHVPLGPAAPEFRIMTLDTGTVRPGLEKSTYRIRHEECGELNRFCKEDFGFASVGEIGDEHDFTRVRNHLAGNHPGLAERLSYLFHAGKRFRTMLSAWERGDIATVGEVFRADGHGLRDEFRISGPELETMCDLVRTVPGVLGERMLGGGDKGASGALVLAESEEDVRRAVTAGYPRSHPDYADRFAIHSCRMVDGITELPGW